MKLIIPIFGDASADSRTLENSELYSLSGHEIFVVTDRPMDNKGCFEIMPAYAPLGHMEPFTPTGTKAAMTALLKGGHITSDQVVAVLDRRTLDKTVPRLNDAIRMYHADGSVPLISVCVSRDHPCTWTHLFEIVSVDLVGIFDEVDLEKFEIEMPWEARHITFPLPSPWLDGVRRDKKNDVIGFSPRYVESPEDLWMKIEGNDGMMWFIRERDLCRRVFQERLKTEGGGAISGCSVTYSSKHIRSFVIKSNDGPLELFLDERFIALGDRVRVIPLRGNTMVDHLTSEGGISAESARVVINDEYRWSTTALKWDQCLPQEEVFDGYFVAVLRSHQGKTGDIEAFFPPVEGLWANRIFPGKRDIYNLITGEPIQGRQQYPVLFVPTGHMYIGTMAQLEKCVKDHVFSYIDME